MKKIFFLLIVFLQILFSKEYNREFKELSRLKSTLFKDIDREFIDQSSISIDEAKKIAEKVNSQFEIKSSQYRNQLLKYSIELSFLEKRKTEKKRDSEEISVTLKNKKSKQYQIEKEIANEYSYLRNLKNLLLSNGTELSSNISTEGYFITFIEDKRSSKRDTLIEFATQSIARESTAQLNGILIETISKFDKKLSFQVKEIISGKSIVDSSDTTNKLFFTGKNRNSVLIYGTKADVYPFENGNQENFQKGKYLQHLRYISIIRNERDIKRVKRVIFQRFPKFKLPNDFDSKIKKALKSIIKHNQANWKILKKMQESRKKTLNRIKKRILSREKSIKLLKSQSDILEIEIQDLNEEFNSLSIQIKEIEPKLKNLYSKMTKHENSYIFSKAEIYHRKFSDPVKETKAIISELISDLDKSFLQTSQRIETLYNSSSVLKEIITNIKYNKSYIYAKIVPYYVPYTDLTGALVILKAKFQSTSTTKNQKFHFQIKPKKIIEKIPNGFVRINAGKFQLGSNNGDSDEKPVHLEKIKKDFLISKYEVTIKDYRKFAKATKRVMPKLNNNCNNDLCPISRINWDDAVAYTKWKSKQDEVTYRLPTEAEWEYVAKVGLNLEYGTTYGDINSFAWFKTNSKGRPHQIGKKEPNLWGVFDMYGNVWEWCSDSYRRNYSIKSTNTDIKVIRGGAWNIKKRYLRASNRSWSHKNTKSISIGFRLIREI